MERIELLTTKGEKELKATRERVESGDSSVYELVAQRLLFENLSGKKGKLPEAENLYNMHNNTFSRRARIPSFSGGRYKLPLLVRDMDERIVP